MAIQEKTEKKFKRISNTNKTEFQEELDLLASQGWTVDKSWILYESYFAELSKPE